MSGDTFALNMRSTLLTLAFASGITAIASDFAGPNQFICGTTTTMQANALSAGEGGFWSVLQGNATFINGNSPTTPVTGMSFGENVLQWTVFGPGGTASDQVSIWCYDNASPQANAGADQSLPPWPGTIQLNGSTPNAPAVCFWSIVTGSGVISDPNDPQASFSAPGIGSNVLQWSCDNGPCGTSTDLVVIEGVVGISEAEALSGFVRYNAAQHALVFAQDASAMTLALHDEQGRLIQRIGIPGGAGVWSLPGLHAGLYLLRADAGQRALVLRFVVTD